MNAVFVTASFGYVSTTDYDTGGVLCFREHQNVSMRKTLFVPAGFNVIMVSGMTYSSICISPHKLLLIGNNGKEDKSLSAVDTPNHVENELATSRETSTDNASNFLESSSAGFSNSEHNSAIEVPQCQRFVEVFEASSLTISYSGSSPSVHAVAFKLQFSFHQPHGSPPRKAPSGRFNCSVDSFLAFRQHLDCNRVQECEEGEDEGAHCLACQHGQNGGVVNCSSCIGGVADCSPCPKGVANCPRPLCPGGVANCTALFCPGAVASPHSSKCYSVEFLTTLPKPSEFPSVAKEKCQEKGGRLAVLKSPLDLITFSSAVSPSLEIRSRCGLSGQLDRGWKYFFYAGIFYGGTSEPNLYRKMWLAEDRSVVYNFFLERENIPQACPVSGMFVNLTNGNSHLASFQKSCLQEGPRSCTLCEYQLRRDGDGSSFKQTGGTVGVSDLPGTSSSSTQLLEAITLPHLTFSSTKPSEPGESTNTASNSNASKENTAAIISNATIEKLLLHSLVECPGQHLTRSFLTCDARVQCGHNHRDLFCFDLQGLSAGYAIQSYNTSTKKSAPSNPSQVEILSGISSQLAAQQFVCADKKRFVHFTLVCDFRPDCVDGSDETFCFHESCHSAFKCNNGQCVSYLKRGDLFSDCYDDSDEGMVDYATYYPSYDVAVYRLNPPVVFDFDQQGNVLKEKLDVNVSCPDTHYRCPGRSTVCLPVFTRCNGYYDCEGREDEDGCDTAECPGLYRCLDSQVCVHPDHVCDGWPQCPQRDDEWLCEENQCPDGCLCQGLAFVCLQSFPARLYPQLRYLHAGHSKMSPEDLQTNVYLVYLALPHCHLTDVPGMGNKNLQYLDLSYNQLKTFNTSVVLPLINLHTLLLSHNPLTKIHGQEKSGKMGQTALRTVDLSFTEITFFSSKPFERLASVSVLNLSFTPLREITSEGFHFLPRLAVLDLDHCSALDVFPVDVFSSLSNLHTVTAHNYRLCCRAILPAHLDQRFCSAPQDELSSCDDLLRSGVYRVFSWLLCALSVTGNVCCLAFRSCVQRNAGKSAFNVFVSSLGVADLLMGVYMVIIAAADVSYRGSYLLNERAWTRSVACRTAGFLSLLSCEVSSLTILLITLDRFIVLRFPFTPYRFRTNSATLVTMATWGMGVVMAAAPLLPVTSHWQFYSQTGTCIPLPVTRLEFKGQGYSVGILILLNFVLFVLVAAGQAFIYWSVKKHSLVTDATRKSHDLTVARRLITVAVTDFLCWFPIGLCGILAWTGTAIPGEVGVAMAMLVLPLNAALNPFLYTFNLVMEKRRNAQEERLLNKLLANDNEKQ